MSDQEARPYRLALLVILLAASVAMVWQGQFDFKSGGLLVIGAMTLLWVISLPIKDASIVDIFWGLGFVMLAWWAYSTNPGPAALRDWLLCALVTVWGVRLALHIGVRNLGHGEDPRYQAWRRAGGSKYWIVSYLRVFLLQGLLMWVIAAPLLVSQHGGAPTDPYWLDAVAVVVWIVGFVFEALGDWQLSRFKADPANRGKVMDSGLWSLTRHPNYFGDALQWWAFFLFAVSAGGWWTIFSPVLMTILLMKVSGVTLLESSLDAKPGYRKYVESTPAFFPRLP